MVIVEEYDGEEAEGSPGPAHGSSNDSSDHGTSVLTRHVHSQFDNFRANGTSRKPDGGNEGLAPPVDSTGENLGILEENCADEKCSRPRGTDQSPPAPASEGSRGELRHPQSGASLFAAGVEAHDPAHATANPSGSVDDHVPRQRQRPETQRSHKKGRTRIPKRLVHRDALFDLAYPFVEERDFFVLSVALSEDEINELLENSRSYKEGSTSAEKTRLRPKRRRRRLHSSSSSTASRSTTFTGDGIESARRAPRSRSFDVPPPPPPLSFPPDGDNFLRRGSGTDHWGIPPPPPPRPPPGFDSTTTNDDSTNGSDESDAPTTSVQPESIRPTPSSENPYSAGYLPPYYRRPLGEDGQWLAHDVPLSDVRWPTSWTTDSQKLPPHHTAKHILAATQHSENDGTFIDLSFNQTQGVSDIMQWIHVQEARVTLDRLTCLVQALPGLTKEERLVAEKLLHDQRRKGCSTLNGIPAHQAPVTVVRYDSWDDFPSPAYTPASVTLLAFSIFVSEHEGALVDQSQCSKKLLIQTLYPYEDAFDLDRRQVFTNYSPSGKELLYTSHVFVLTFANLLLTFSEVSAATLSEPIVRSTELHEKVARSPQFAAVRTPRGTIVNIEIDPFPSYLDLREQIKLRCLLSDSDVFVLRSPDGSVLDAGKWLKIPDSLDTPVIEIEVDVFAAQTRETSVVAQVADITDSSSETEVSTSSESTSVVTRRDTRSSIIGRQGDNYANTTQSEPGLRSARQGTVVSVPQRSKNAYSEAAPSQRPIRKNARQVQFKHEGRKSAPSDAVIAYGDLRNRTRPFMNDPSLRSPILKPELFNVRLEALRDNATFFRLESSPPSLALVKTELGRSSRRVHGQNPSEPGKRNWRKAEHKEILHVSDGAQITSSDSGGNDRDLLPRKADDGTEMILEGSAPGCASSSAILSSQDSSAQLQENSRSAANSPPSGADTTPLHSNEAKLRGLHGGIQPLEPQQVEGGRATPDSEHVQDTGQAAELSSWRDKALSRSLFLPHLIESPNAPKDDIASRPWPPEPDLGGPSQNNVVVGSNQAQRSAQSSCQYTKHKSEREHQYRTSTPPIFVWGIGHPKSDPGLRWIYDTILKDCHKRLSQARKDDNLHITYTRAYAVNIATLAAVLGLGGIKHSHDQEARLLTATGVERIRTRVLSSIEVQQEYHALDLSALAASLVTYTGCVLELFVTIDVPAEPLHKVWGSLARMQESIRSTTAISQLVLKDPPTCDKIAERHGVPKPSLRVDPGHQCNSLAFAGLEDAVQHLQRFHYAPGCAPSSAVLRSFVAEEKADLRNDRLVGLLGVLQQYHEYLEAFFETVEDIVLSVATADATARSQLKLTVSLLRSFESFVHTHVKFAQLFGVIDRSKRSSSGRDLSLRFINKLPGLKREAAALCNVSLETLRTAYHEIVVLSRAKASIAAVELSQVGMPSIVAAILYNAQASVLTNGDNVVQQYERCVVKLQYQVNRFPRKKQLEQIHRLQEELAAVQQIIRTSAQIVKNYMTTLSPDTFRIAPPTRSTTFPIEAGLLNRILYKAHDHLNALSVLQHRASGLADQVKRSVEVMEEDHGKAILTFTVVTTIFLPLSFLTGFFGMNTSDIRNMRQGQATFWAVAVPFTLVVASAILFLAFKGGDLLERVGGIGGIGASIRRGVGMAVKAFGAVPRTMPKRGPRRTDTGLTWESV
ncbi:putative mg2+ transporter protein [Teratosphaeria destructans]|uniref:Mg2+ transporter protein n=1 Tax=Teratosphaeria destructans TaxID=418781 RepID=A0A9W7SXE2_9PEZI|nr:putative mg2+ transporter protein [Teratosphaeria destructans]